MVQISNTMDTASLVSQLMSVERIPQNLLKQRVSALQSKQSAWSQIGSQVTALQTAAESLAPMGSLGKLMTATSSNDAALGVRVTGVAAASQSNVEVLNLATTHSVVSSDTFTDALASDGGRSLTVTVNGEAKTYTSADGSIGGLVSAVNADSSTVKAKLLQTSASEYKLVLTAAKSGTVGSFSTAGSTGWSGLTAAVTGTDANLKVDGVSVSRSSNVITDLVGGVELTLRQTTSAPVQVAVARDDDSVVNKVKALVDAANSVINTVKKQTATSDTAEARGVLAGDSSAQALADSIRNSIAAGITGTDGVVRPASTLGVSLTRDGVLSFDEAKLRASLTKDPAAVAAMLGRGGSSTASNVSVTSVLSSASPGPHAISVTQIASASALVGVPIPPPPAGSTINMTVTTPDGTVTVTFAAGATYAQTAANLTQAMGRANLQITATTDGADGDTSGTFSLTEKRLGSKFTFSATSSELGLSGAAIHGNDARATIDGKSVTASGATIIQNGVAINVGVTATQLANAGGQVSGTLTVSDGLAGLLARIGGKSTTATATTAKDGLDSQIKDLQTRIDRYDDSLKLKEDALRKKFTAMDTVLTRLQGQMSSLANFTNSLG